MVRRLRAGAEWIRTFGSALDRQWFRGFVRVGAIYLRVGHSSPPRPRRTDRVVGRRSEKRHSPPESKGVTTDRAVEVSCVPLSETIVLGPAADGDDAVKLL